MVLNCDKDRFALQNIKAYYHVIKAKWYNYENIVWNSTEQALETRSIEQNKLSWNKVKYMHILYLSYSIIFLEYNKGFPGGAKIQAIRNEVQIFQQISEKVYLKLDNQIRPSLYPKHPNSKWIEVLKVKYIKNK